MNDKDVCRTAPATPGLLIIGPLHMSSLQMALMLCDETTLRDDPGRWNWLDDLLLDYIYYTQDKADNLMFNIRFN